MLASRQVANQGAERRGRPPHHRRQGHAEDTAGTVGAVTSAVTPASDRHNRLAQRDDDRSTRSRSTKCSGTGSQPAAPQEVKNHHHQRDRERPNHAPARRHRDSARSASRPTPTAVLIPRNVAELRRSGSSRFRDPEQRDVTTPDPYAINAGEQEAKVAEHIARDAERQRPGTPPSRPGSTIRTAPSSGLMTLRRPSVLRTTTTGAPRGSASPARHPPRSDDGPSGLRALGQRRGRGRGGRNSSRSHNALLRASQDS